MELEDAITTAILTLKEAFEGAINENNIEIGVVTKDRKFRVLSATEVKVRTTAVSSTLTNLLCACIRTIFLS